MKKNFFEDIAKHFIEYVKNGIKNNEAFNEPFHFILNDGNCDFEYGTKLIYEFDNWIFVTSMYGDGSCVSVSVLTFEDDLDRDWDDELDKITDYYYENYKDFVE